MSINGKELLSLEELEVHSGRMKMDLWKKLNIEIRKFSVTDLN